MFRPPPRKIKKSDGPICILCNEPCIEKEKFIHEEKWKSFRSLAEKWKGLEKFGGVLTSVDWESGPHGNMWHKNCQLHFTGARKLEQALSKRKALAEEAEEEEKTSGPKKEERPSTRSKTGVIQDPDLCIWCMKATNGKHSERYGKSHSVRDEKAWAKIGASIPYISESNMRERLQILIDSTPNWETANVTYHGSCYKSYTKCLYNAKGRSVSVPGEGGLKELDQQFLSDVATTIFDDGEPRTLRHLLQEYEDLVLRHGFPKTTKRTHDIRVMLENNFGDSVGFHTRYRRNESTFVFDKKNCGCYIEAAMNGWAVSDERLVEILGSRLRDNVRKTHENFSWPPTVSDLIDDPSPHPLLLSLLCSLSGKSKETDPTSQIIYLADILESHITSKRTRLKTQFAISLHGATRSRDLSDIAADMGIANTYKDVHYLYDFWGLDELQNNPKCPAEIADGKPGTVILDNDDWQISDVTGGSQSVNRTNMMFIQPQKWITQPISPRNVAVARTTIKQKLSTISDAEHKIKVYSTSIRGKPESYQKVDLTPGTTKKIRSKLFAHTLARINEDEEVETNETQDSTLHSLGAFTGFMSSIMPRDDKSKPYYFLSLPKPPSKAVVFTILEKAVLAAEEKNMPFIQVAGDQPVYTFIIELKNENREKFKLIIPVLGSFHTQMSFMYTIYKHIKGSNIEDLLAEAGLITIGSVHKALMGKDYSRALRIYKLLYESLARMLILHGKCDDIDLHSTLLDLINTIKNTELNQEERVMAFETLIEGEKFHIYIQELRKNVDLPDNHMAKYFLGVMDMIEILFLHIDSLRTKNWKQFTDSLRLMIPWMLSYDNSNYGRWLPVFWLDMVTLSDEHTEYMSEIFAQSMTGNAYSAMPPDMWIECTMNKNSKLKAGWKRLLKNERGLMIHIKNMNNVNIVRNTLVNMIGQLKRKSTHRENTRNRISADKKGVNDIISLMQEWNSDPFDQSQQDLRTLMSGQIANEDLQKDLENAKSDGEKVLLKMFNDRFFSSEKSVFDTITRQKRKTFASSSKNKSEHEDTASLARGVAINLVNLCVKENLPIFENRITDECLSIFNANGTIRKNQKSKLKDSLTFEELHVLDYIAIIDAGFLWRLSTPKSDEYQKGDGTKLTWHDYAVKLFDINKSRHPNAKSFIWVNDYYGHDVVNIKDSESNKRKEKFTGGDSPNVFPSRDKDLPSIRLFNEFFKNSYNKQRLQKFLQEEFHDLCLQHGITMIYCTRSNCFDISSTVVAEKAVYKNEKIEADNAIFFIYYQIRESGEESPVVIDAEDMDVLVTSAYVTAQIPGVLGIKKKKKIFDCGSLCSIDIAPLAIRAHVISGCDAISGFFGKGKKSIWSSVSKYKEARNLLHDFDENSLRDFTIKYIYNDKKSSSFAEMREKKWILMKKKRFERIGIDEDSHVNRTKRVIFVAKSMENFRSPLEFGNPLSYGFILNHEMKCVPNRYNKEALPSELLHECTRLAGEEDQPEDDEDCADDEEDEESDDDDIEDDDQEEIDV